ncbi:MAG: hypothetical protein ACRCR2_03660 [Fusobacteriaceae bacterium]
MKKRDIAREDLNNAKRNICKGHVFVKVIHKIDRWKCHYCGYETNGSFVKGYEEGVEHERKY